MLLLFLLVLTHLDEAAKLGSQQAYATEHP